MLDAITVATAVATAVSGTVEYAPDFTVGDTQTKRIIVVPYGVAESISARGRKDTDITLQVAIIKRVGGTDTASTLISSLQALGDVCLGSTYAGAVCVGVNYISLYSVVELRGKNVYTGVFEMTLRGE